MITKLQSFAWLLAVISICAEAHANDRTVRTSVEGIEAYLPPPDDFAPLKASDAELAEYGFPPKPNRETDPQGYSVWEKIVNMKRIMPVLEQTNVYYVPARIGSEKKLSAILAYATSVNWSGYAIEDGNNPFKNAIIGGELAVHRPFIRCDHLPTNTFYSAQWVGIDGYNSSDVLQAGTTVKATCPAPAGEPHGGISYPWVEWYPRPSAIVNNVFAQRGETVAILIQATAGGPGIVTLGNYHYYQSVTLKLDPPSGTKLVGNSIEWIVERPTIDGKLSYLTPFTSIPWTKTFATVGGTTYYPGNAPTGTTKQIDMTVDGTPATPVMSHSVVYSSAEIDAKLTPYTLVFVGSVPY